MGLRKQAQVACLICESVQCLRYLLFCKQEETDYRVGWTGSMLSKKVCTVLERIECEYRKGESMLVGKERFAPQIDAERICESEEGLSSPK